MLGFGLTAVLALVPATARAQGGPPLLTDDPDTPGPGHWEINTAAVFDNSHAEHRLEAPLVDLNYGVGRRIQLKLEMPWLRVRETGTPAQTGMGNSTVGVKWRFLGQEHKTLAWSIYPQVEFNNGHSSAAKGLVENGSQLLLPTEVTLELGHFEIYGEIGRIFVHDGEDVWVDGVTTEIAVAPRLELLAELHGESHASDPSDVVFNIGARQTITQKIVLLLAVGRGSRGGPEHSPHLILYSGIQLRLPGPYSFDTPAH